MIHLFEAETADRAWQAAADYFRDGDRLHQQDGRGGSTYELLHAAFTISNPRERWVVNREPPLNPAFAIAEIVWIVNGSNDAAFLNNWNRRLPDFAGTSDHYHGAYGYRLRQHFGVDQLERAYLALRHARNTRQVVLQIWDAVADLPDLVGQPVDTDIPCNITSILKIRSDKLEWMQVMRSNDLFRGTPYNFIQFTTLQEVLAGWLGVGVGSYNQLSDSLHLYEVDMQHVASRLDNQPSQNSDNLGLPYDQSRSVFAALFAGIEALAQPNLTEAQLMLVCEQAALPPAYGNLCRVMAAEAARRRGWAMTARDQMSQCTNAALQQMWSRWLNRVQL